MPIKRKGRRSGDVLVRQKLHDLLREGIIDKVEDLGLPTATHPSSHGVGDYGCKIWVLPPRYYKWLLNKKQTRQTLYEYCSQIGAVRGLVSPCEVRIANHDRSTWDKVKPSSRPIGGGAIGQALFSEVVLACMIHSLNASDRIPQLPKGEYRRVSREITLGLPLREIRRLSEKYGSMMAIPLSMEESIPGGAEVALPPFGVLTVHTRRGVDWNDLDDLEAVYALAQPIAQDCADVLCADWYDIPKSAYGLEDESIDREQSD